MKRYLSLLLAAMLLFGCAADHSMDKAATARQAYLNASGCRFRATVTADYGKMLHTFILDCTWNETGDMTFQVVAPETIQGIRGSVSGEAGKLTFDGMALAFDKLADGQIAPVTAPWLLIETLRGGYIAAGGDSKEGLHLTMHDSYADDAVQLEVWLDSENKPIAGEIIWQGRRILTVTVEKFEFL